MKKLIVLLFPITLFLVSCNGGKLKELSSRNEELEKELNEIKENEKLLKGDYNSAIESLNSIDDTLRIIGEREKTMQQLASQMTGEGAVAQKQKIMAQIDALAKANEASKNYARGLQNQLSKMKVENEGLKKMIAQNEEKLKAKEQEIAVIQKKIDELQVIVDKLDANVKEKTGELADAYAQLKSERDKLAETNTKLTETNKALEESLSKVKEKDSFIGEQAKGYVVCGTKKALRQNDIMKKLNDQLTPEYRQKVIVKANEFDYYNNNKINCSGDGKIESVLPKRPSDSYEIDGMEIKILDSKKFWGTDKVVVIVKD